MSTKSWPVHVFLAINATRACAVIAARRLPEKRAGEEFLASLDILSAREISAAQEAVAACRAVLKESGVHGWPAYFALLHLGSWIAFGLMIIVMAVVGLMRYL